MVEISRVTQARNRATELQERLVVLSNQQLEWAQKLSVLASYAVRNDQALTLQLHMEINGSMRPLMPVTPAEFQRLVPTLVESILRMQVESEYEVLQIHALLHDEPRPAPEWKQRTFEERWLGLTWLHDHDLYQDGDANIPAGICDRDGVVVLGMCRRCGLAEIELHDAPVCSWRAPNSLTILPAVREAAVELAENEQEVDQ